LRVALDVDGVLADSYIVLSKVIKDKYNVTFLKEYAYQWDAEKCLKHLTGIEITGQEFLSLFKLVWDRWDEIPRTEPDARIIVKLLQGNGHEVDVVTYAVPGTLENKINWLKSNVEGDYRVVDARDASGWKYSLDYDVFIDDCPHVAVGAWKLGKLSILYDQPTNRGVPDSLIDVRITQLQQAVDWLPTEVKPKDDEKRVEFCTLCNGFKLMSHFKYPWGGHQYDKQK